MQLFNYRCNEHIMNNGSILPMQGPLRNNTRFCQQDKHEKDI